MKSVTQPRPSLNQKPLWWTINHCLIIMSPSHHTLRASQTVNSPLFWTIIFKVWRLNYTVIILHKDNFLCHMVALIRLVVSCHQTSHQQHKARLKLKLQELDRSVNGYKPSIEHKRTFRLQPARPPEFCLNYDNVEFKERHHLVLVHTHHTLPPRISSPE